MGGPQSPQPTTVSGLGDGIQVAAGRDPLGFERPRGGEDGPRLAIRFKRWTSFG